MFDKTVINMTQEVKDNYQTFLASQNQPETTEE